MHQNKNRTINREGNSLFILFFVIVFPGFLFAQNKVLTGIVSDSLGIPMESASVMASPLEKEKSLKFSIADEKGRYRLVLEPSVSYTISVSYIGFSDESFLLKPEDNIEVFNFRLEKNKESLKEIVIKYDVRPMIIKKDTMIFNVDSFTNGSERRLKEQLKKLPGVEVDKDGNVTLQGKRVTSFLVENGSFFGGGTKLGVENIPADAVDKVEFIDHFNEIAFLKEVSGSQQLAMNIKLKSDKKEFAFGDIEVASGTPDYYKLHSGIFYYGGKTNTSFIGDLNNVGDSTLDFNDIYRFDSGSAFLEKSSAIEDLFGFARNNKDVVASKSKFSAGNFSHKYSDKTEISGYALVSGVFSESKKHTDVVYFQNDLRNFEERGNTVETDNSFFLGRVKFKHRASSNEQLNYDANLKITDRNQNDNLASVTNLRVVDFKTISDLDNFALNHFLEWHKSYSNTQTTTFVLSHNYEEKKVYNNWQTTDSFLQDLIPVQEDNRYDIRQLNDLKSNRIDALFKYNWIVNNFNHLYFTLGNTYGNTNFNSDEKQLLTTGAINDFSENEFGNNLHHQFNDVSMGIEYKFLVKKLTNKIGLTYHHYFLSNQNPSEENIFRKGYFEPRIESEYEFNKGEALTANYKLSNEFPEYDKGFNRFTMLSYNSVFKGNPLVTAERYNYYSLYYKKNSLLQGLIFNAGLNYYKKNRAIRNEVVLEGINQFSTLIQTNHPEDNLFFRSNITKDVYKFNVGLNGMFSSMNYFQTINGKDNAVDRNSTNIGIILKTIDKKWPYLTLRYNKSFDHFNGISSARFNSDVFSLDYDVVISDRFVVKVFYDYQSNKSSSSKITSFQTANFSFGYQPVKSSWKFEIDARNILDNSIRNANSFSQYISTNQTTYILPRIIMFSVSYKL